MLLFCVAILTADPPKELPSLETVKKAYRENVDRLKNRRVKFVRVRLPGSPEKEFPALDHPERDEVEATISARNTLGPNWRGKVDWRTFRSGVLARQSIHSWNERRSTRLETKPGPDQKLKTTVEIHGPDVGHSELSMIEMDVSGSMIEMLGIRTKLALLDSHPGLIELNPRVDDLSEIQDRWILDPSKNYWPVEVRRYTKRPDRSLSLNSNAKVVEFLRVGDAWYPKKVLRPWSRDETLYYTVVSVEFPESFEDAAFAVPIPKGTFVKDNVKRSSRIEGEEERPWVPDRPLGVVDRLKGIPGEDWLFYGGFVGATTLFVFGSIFLFRRARRKEQTKAAPQ